MGLKLKAGILINLEKNKFWHFKVHSKAHVKSKLSSQDNFPPSSFSLNISVGRSPLESYCLCIWFSCALQFCFERTDLLNMHSRCQRSRHIRINKFDWFHSVFLLWLIKHTCIHTTNVHIYNTHTLHIQIHLHMYTVDSHIHTQTRSSLKYIITSKILHQIKRIKIDRRWYFASHFSHYFCHVVIFISFYLDSCHTIQKVWLWTSHVVSDALSLLAIP